MAVNEMNIMGWKIISTLGRFNSWAQKTRLIIAYVAVLAPWQELWQSVTDPHFKPHSWCRGQPGPPLYRGA